MKGNQVEETQLQQLAEPFPEQLIKPAPAGQFGEYVAHSTVTERLLSIVGPFDYEVTEVIRGEAPAVIGKGKEFDADNPKHPARSNAVVGCLARMGVTIDGRKVYVTEVGDVDMPARNSDGSNLKNASSDAIKRCAMRLGLGLHLWSQEDYFLDLQLASPKDDDEAELDRAIDAEAVAEAFGGEVVEGKEDSGETASD